MFRTHATNTSTTMNYTNVAYDPFPYKMMSAALTTESTSKWRHWHHVYRKFRFVYFCHKCPAECCVEREWKQVTCAWPIL